MLSIPLHSTLLKPPHQLSAFSVHNVSNWLFSFSKKTLKYFKSEKRILPSIFSFSFAQQESLYKVQILPLYIQVSQPSAAWLSTPFPWNWSCQVNNGLVDPISLGLLGTSDTLTIPLGSMPVLYASIPILLQTSLLPSTGSP